MLKEFREFITRGSVIDLAVGIIIGAAFTSIVNSLVNDIIMPPIGVLLNGVDFSQIFIVLQQGDPAGPYNTIAAAQEAGAATLNIGQFINAVIEFLIIAFVIFLMVRTINQIRRQREEEQAQEAPAAPTEPTTEEKLIQQLARLNDYLDKQGQ
ncbi:MAG: large conductance mechanosensitive channel protein MscL [Chloroflexota bacterium]